jgi:hypothetical protein
MSDHAPGMLLEQTTLFMILTRKELFKGPEILTNEVSAVWARPKPQNSRATLRSERFLSMTVPYLESKTAFVVRHGELLVLKRAKQRLGVEVQYGVSVQYEQGFVNGLDGGTHEEPFLVERVVSVTVWNGERLPSEAPNLFRSVEVGGDDDLMGQVQSEVALEPSFQEVAVLGFRSPVGDEDLEFHIGGRSL